MLIAYTLKVIFSLCHFKIFYILKQGRAEHFQIGVALRKIRCGASKCWCGDKEIIVVVSRLIEVKGIDYLQWR